MGDYRDLSVWRRAHNFAMAVYRTTCSFPDSELYGLTAQLRRGSISVVSNIVEGTSRYPDRDQEKFFRIARSSASEVECQLLLSRDVGYLGPAAWLTLDNDCRNIGRMLSGLIRSSCRKGRVKKLRLATSD